MKSYTDTHDWIEQDRTHATVGIRQSAVKELGEIVYIELPKIGMHIQQGQVVAVLESTKAAIDLHSPLVGEIVEVNKRLIDNVNLINSASETDGWLYKVALINKK